MSSTSDVHQLRSIYTGDTVDVMTFTANGEHLVCGTSHDVQVWRMADGEKVATMGVDFARCVAASNDGRWIAAGTTGGEVLVWDTTTYKHVFVHHDKSTIFWDLDFSPDSTRLVSARGITATIWDFAARQNVRTLDHAEPVLAAKYTPQGDRIATATEESVRVWDSNAGRLLVNLKVQLEPRRGLLWFNSHLFIRSYGRIKKIDAATGLTVSGWSANGNHMSLPQDGQFMAYTKKFSYQACRIILCDTAPSGLSCTLEYDGFISSIALSSDGRHLAVAHGCRQILVRKLSQSVSDPELHIDNAALNAWKRGELADAEVLLSAAIQTSENRDHVLASRALVRARLGKWDAALVDAEDADTGKPMFIKTQPSIVGSIAKCVALICKGEKDEGFRVCDIASQDFDSEDVTLLRLIQAVLLFMTGKHVDAISSMNELVLGPWVISTSHIVQAYMHLLLGNKHMEDGDYERAIQSFELARTRLGNPTSRPPLIVSLISGWEFDGLAITIQQRCCVALFSANRIKEAGESVLRMVDQGIDMTESNKTWPSDFKRHCCSTLGDLGNGSLNAKQYGEAVLRYTAALSFDPSSPQDLLIKRSNAWMGKGARQEALSDATEWARMMLKSGSWKDALIAAVDSALARSTIYRAVCEHLEATGRITDAVACFHRISSELAQEIEASWIRDFKNRCYDKLYDLGDSALKTQRYNEAILQYTSALSLDPASPQNLLVKRSRAYAEKGEWEDALNDANEVIKLDPSDPSGYERKYEVLLGTGHNKDAIDVLEMLLFKMSQSCDPEIHERSRRYVRPERAKEAVRTSIQNAIRDSPLVLINILSGRLCDKSEQAAAFESTPAFATLVASMPTHIDHPLIEKVVGEFYRYTTFSHTWEDNEPLHEKVTKIMVYDLGTSSTHEKLKMFCKIVRDGGFNWAWSDTCCIDQKNPTVLQESLVSMFKWYEGSAMTIIFLYDVDRLAEIGALIKSKWNSRGWTLQEYHASKVVRIYTKDWTPYLGLGIHNHKESPEIISEMEMATGISARALMALRPGLNDVREKLRLASTRQTTRVEDAAYSLLGIFSMTLSVTYGEGDRALGRLLSQLLTSSGDTSILAWTGTRNSFNSCLPSNIVVFSQPVASHIPPAIPHSEMETITTGLYASELDLELVARLYEEVDELPTPTFSAQRMRLPCLAFKIRSISRFQNGSEVVFRAQAGVLGVVEIKTRQNLTRPDSLYLIHPWIGFLLDRHASELDDDNTSELDGSPSRDSLPDLSSVSDADDVDSPTSPTVPLMNAQMEFLARLGQPFGALLFAPTRRNMAEYKRIATESLIMAQVQEITSATLNRLIRGVRVLDVL